MFTLRMASKTITWLRHRQSGLSPGNSIPHSRTTPASGYLRGRDHQFSPWLPRQCCTHTLQALGQGAGSQLREPELPRSLRSAARLRP